MGETERQMHALRVASKTTSLTRFADLPLVPKHELMLRCHYASVDLYNAPGGASEVAALEANKKGHLVETVPVSVQFRDAHVLRRIRGLLGSLLHRARLQRGLEQDPPHLPSTSSTRARTDGQLEESGQEHRALLRHAQPANAKFGHFCARDTTALGKIDTSNQSVCRVAQEGLVDGQCAVEAAAAAVDSRRRREGSSSTSLRPSRPPSPHPRREPSRSPAPRT